MKKVLLSILIIIGLAAVLPAFAQESINAFSAEISIKSDSSIHVTEQIVYDFGSEQRHGIFREIPVKYDTPRGNRSIDIDDIMVTDQNGNSYITDISNSGNNKVIRIGDPDIFVTGLKTYLISFTVEGALNYFDDQDELYWNVTGDEWPVVINSASVTVSAPNNSPINEIDFTCFAGIRGSNYPCETSTINNKINFSHGRLLSGEGLTIVIGLPKGTVAEPSAFDKIISAILDNLVLLLPIATLIIMYRLWQLRGRDPKGRGVIVAQYESPKDLTPAEVGTIIDERVQPKDTSAMIIDLAVRGYLKIKRLEKSGLFGKVDYELVRLKAGNDLKNQFEKDFFEKLFTTKTMYSVSKTASVFKKFSEMFQKESVNSNIDVVKISELKNSFYKTLLDTNKKIYESVVTKGYFNKSPNSVRAGYGIAGALIIVIGIVIAGAAGFYATLGLVVSGIMVSIFGLFMPQRTAMGAEIREEIEGLKQYLSVAEKDRIKFHNAPEKSPEQFEKLLPYAMVLGVEKQWAEQFKDIYHEPPNWYEGRPGDVLTSAFLVNTLSDFNSEAQSVLASSPSSAASGGSGFSGGGSGGGFGGGGGGSW